MSPNVEPVLIPIGSQRIFATYHTPSKPLKKNPAVLFLHGYQSTKNDRFRFTYELAEELKEDGIASLRIDFRGCGDSDGKSCELTIRSQKEDTLASLEWLSQRHQRLAMVGRSLGSAIGIQAAALFPVESLVLMSPLFDGSQWKDIPHLSQMGALSVEEDLKKLSKTPILQFHAEKDEVLSSHHLYSFQRLATPFHTIRVIPGADHTYSSKEARKILGKETRVWFINAFDDHQDLRG